MHKRKEDIVKTIEQYTRQLIEEARALFHLDVVKREFQERHNYAQAKGGLEDLPEPEEILQTVRDATIEQLPETMIGLHQYAECWASASEIHAQAGAYESFVSFMNVRPGDLVVDLGCGSGGLLKTLIERNVAVIGVDLNPFLLEKAREYLLGVSGIQGVDILSDLSVGYSPGRGIVFRGTPEIFEHDFRNPILLFDDFTNPQNLIRLLYANGRMADRVAFILPGGSGAQTSLEIWSHLRGQDKDLQDPLRRKKGIIDTISSYIARDGQFISALRTMRTIEEKQEEFDALIESDPQMHEAFSAFAEKTESFRDDPRVTVLEEVAIPLTPEEGKHISLFLADKKMNEMVNGLRHFLYEYIECERMSIASLQERR